MKEQRLNEPTEHQRKYLALLLSRAHERGVPYLPIETLSKAQVSAWIDYLKTVVVVEAGANSSSSSFLPIRVRTDGYRPVLSEDIADHEHEIEPWQTEDGWEILECTSCGGQW